MTRSSRCGASAGWSSPSPALRHRGHKIPAMKKRLGVARSLALIALALGGAVAAIEQVGVSEDPYVGSDVMIPMRDGVKLHAKIFTPRAQSEPLPFLIERTPYGAAEYAKALDRSLKPLADDGYIFVFEDLRGKFGSEGTFVMNRPARDPSDKKALDEGTDTYDTIDWLLKKVPKNNGKAGMLGVSYEGWTTIMGALEPHPALAAISPQASPADMWLGDDFHHNRAFRLSYGFEYAYELESGKELKQFGF